MPGGQAMFDWMGVYTKFYGVPIFRKTITVCTPRREYCGRLLGILIHEENSRVKALVDQKT